MHAQLVVDDKMRQRFGQEARIGAHIESDHVVEVVAAGVDAQTNMPWIAMELLKGETLAQRIARAPVDLPTAREVMAQLCHALGAAHTAGIVHRDLKPENVFLAVPRRTGVAFTLKVLDFGIAKLVAESHTRATGSIGTPLWMAPEQTEVGKAIRPTSDVWALGLVGFNLLTGKMYWHCANVEAAGAMQLLREVIMEPIESASARAAHYGVGDRVPPGFDAWFARCLDRDPDARHPDARAAHEAIESLVFSSLGAQRPMIVSPVQQTDTQIASAPTVSAGASTTGGASAPKRPDRSDRDDRDDRDDDGDDDDALGPARVKTGTPIGAWIIGALVAAGAIFAAVMFLRGNDKDAPDPSTQNAQNGHHVDKPDESARPPDDPLVPAVNLPPLQDTSHLTDANQVLERERWRMLACYKQTLVDAPDLTGTITFQLKIDTAGRVTSVDPSTSIADTHVSECLLPIFQSMEFKAPIGGATSLSVPVTLSKVPQSMANIPIAPTNVPLANASASTSVKK
jgi:serine/threonine protein kinase